MAWKSLLANCTGTATSIMRFEMLGFARDIVFFRVNGGYAEKRWLACATVAGVVALAWDLSRMAHAMELKVPGDFSSVLALCYGALLSLCRSQWLGCVKASRKVLVLQQCLAILVAFCRSLLAERAGIATAWMRFECFSGKRRFRCREKLARWCDGFGRRRFSMESVSRRAFAQ